MKKIQKVAAITFLSMTLLGTSPLIAQETDNRTVNTTNDDDDDDDDHGNWGLLGLLGLLGLAGLRKKDDDRKHSTTADYQGTNLSR